jgi:hypothetical protein
MKARKGNVAEINLLLTAMLRYAGLEAYPVILSTTEHGYALEMFPMIRNFNYVITQLKLPGKNMYLDASYPTMAFGRLAPDCLAGQHDHHCRLLRIAYDPG